MNTLRCQLASALLLPLSLTAFATTRYVDMNSTNTVPPYTNSATAANVIQDAVDAAEPGDTVLVANGAYTTGGRAAGTNLLANRVVIEKAITVRSVNGPEVTVIVGAAAAEGGNGNGAVRCAYLGTNACLSGFTLTNGHTRTTGEDRGGGGVWCPRSGGTVTNCVLSGNSAVYGGGAFWGRLYDCILTGNNSTSWGGGAYFSTLSHCRLSGNSAAEHAGAVHGGSLYNCTLNGNTAGERGGGAYQSALYNCILAGNSAFRGGGVASGRLYNCTVVDNTALERGGGTDVSEVYNSIVYYNSAAIGANVAQSILTNSCTIPLPFDGGNNIAEDPKLASATHLSAESPCIGAGSLSFATGVDNDGDPWLNPPCIGADQLVRGSAFGPLSVAIGGMIPSVATGFQMALTAKIEGYPTASAWDFGDGTVLSNRPFSSHAWALPGAYSIRLIAFNDTFPGGLTATALVQVAERPAHYVNQSNVTPVFPYASWETAATNIQDAVDASAIAGRTVWVTNGVYDTGGRVVVGSLVNRVALTNAVELRSVNGPAVTLIRGAAAPASPSGNGDGAIRCAHLAEGAVLSGFTLTNGHTRAAGDIEQEQSGGGVWSEIGGLVTNCLLVGNAANQFGGGASRGTLRDCVLSKNVAAGPPGTYYFGQGGGASKSVLYNCTLTENSALNAGGAYYGVLFNCALRTNISYNFGGGTRLGSLYNCTFGGNSAKSSGGGAYYSALYNCTLAGNTAGNGGGVAYPTLYNCIVYGNIAPNGPDYYYTGSGSSFPINYCCTTPMPTNGIGNLTNAPLWVDVAVGNLRLLSDSACIDAGTNYHAADSPELDGRPRIVGGTVDMGAYEHQGPGMGEFLGWLEYNALPTDGSADFADTDLDGHNNWQEWRADTVPTNAFSRLTLLAPTNAAPGVAVTWQSVATRSYFLERGTDLAGVPALLPLATNLPGQSGTTTFTDTTATNGGPFFYRVGVQ